MSQRKLAMLAFSKTPASTLTHCHQAASVHELPEVHTIWGGTELPLPISRLLALHLRPHPVERDHRAD
eukprot:2828270-Alexandrium_andersonii.AAC.1